MAFNSSYAPQTVVRLLRGVPLDNTYRDTFDWKVPANQSGYFSGKTKVSFTDFTYQRQFRSIRVPIIADEIYDCNYVMWQNSSFGQKWFYAFITQIEYVNNETSEVFFTLDVMQTWWFDFNVVSAFVEREHVNDDSIGANLIDEGLALGDYITNDAVPTYFDDFMIIVGSTVDLTAFGSFPPVSGKIYGNIYSGVRYTVFNDETFDVLNSMIEDLSAAGKIDAITSMYMLPKACVPTSGTSGELPITPAPEHIMNLPDNRTFEGWSPRNGKLYTYPYQALVISNNEGNANVLRYEFFQTTTPSMVYRSSQQANSRIIAIPIFYAGLEENYSESIAIGNFPQCSWVRDVYSNWLAAQSIRWGYASERLIRNTTSDFVATNLGRALRNPFNVGGNAINAATDAVGAVNDYLNFGSSVREEREVHSIIPPGVGGTVGNGYTLWSNGKYGFIVEARSIKKEIAQSIDNYFTAYGYKVNKLKKPNITGRPYWNFVKTSGVTITGSVPVDAMSAIKGIFNSGVTFWHGDWVGRYDLNNKAAIEPSFPPTPDPDPDPDPPTPPDPSEPTGAIWGVPFSDWASHVTSEFGPRVNPVTGVYENHDGIDIAYPEGTPIAAIAAGECIRNTSSAGRGKYVTVQVTPEYLYIYQHLSSGNIQVGDQVTLGQSGIANVGSTGQVTGPHLHLEIWANNTPVNPRPFLEGDYNPST